jgi:hypothetical protein
VTAAGIIWIVFGSLSVLGAIFQLILAFAGGKGGAQDRASPAGQTPGALCGALFGAVFIHVGLQSIRGNAKDVLGNAIGSIIFGVLYTGIGGILIIFTGESVLIITAVLLFLLALALYSAGVLALVGRSDYQAFRRATDRPRKRRRSAE